jgi:hypothetical protein
MTGLNRGMRSWRKAFGARRLQFAVLFSVVVDLVGTVCIHAYEREVNSALTCFGDALWRSELMLITLGFSLRPETRPELILAFMIGPYFSRSPGS